MNLKRLRYLVAASVLVLMTFPLHANVLLPGGSVSPDVFADPGSVPLLGDLSGTFNFGGGALIGSWEEVVLVDPFGITCAGCLDFAFALDNSSAVYRINAADLSYFFGYSTDVGYIDQSGVAPNLVDRGPFGGSVGFGFNIASSFVLPGDSTAVLIVATNALTYDNLGNINIFGVRDADSSLITGMVTGLFEPTFQTPVPEPSTLLLLSLGMMGIAAFRKRAS